MNDDRRAEALLSDWLASSASNLGSGAVHERSMEAVGRARQRQGWLIGLRGGSMGSRARTLDGVGRWGVILLLLAGLTLTVGVAAFVGSAPQRSEEHGLIAYGRGGDIWVSAPDGTEPRALTSGPAVDLAPTFSPDGRWIAYWSSSQVGVPLEDMRLTVMALDGSQARVVVEHVNVSNALDTAGLPSIAWSPDGERIAYAQAVYRGMGFEVDIDVVAIAPGATGMATIADASQPAWSSDGRELAYTHLTMSGGNALVADKILAVSTDGRGTSRDLLGAGMSQILSLVWSPDGAHIAYSGKPVRGVPFTVTIADVAGVREWPIAPADHGDQAGPSWSADGQRIAFLQADGGLLAHPIVANVDGSHPTTLDVPVSLLSLTQWSPEGDSILVMGASEARELLRIDVTGTAPPLVVASGVDGGFSWQVIE